MLTEIFEKSLVAEYMINSRNSRRVVVDPDETRGFVQGEPRENRPLVVTYQSELSKGENCEAISEKEHIPSLETGGLSYGPNYLPRIWHKGVFGLNSFKLDSLCSQF
jgi:hypothetical protein